MPPSVIETENLRKVYRDVVAVDSLTLSVEQGEVFGFLGPNGAGKTTTVKMLLGLVRPSSGRASLLGYKPGEPRAMAQVGFLPEHFHYHPWLTANDFLDFHGRLYGIPDSERRQRIPTLLERVGLGGRGGSRLSEFSKGMTQRIGLAQALLSQPAVVFLDEPTSGLDPLGRRQVRDLIRDLRSEGVTVFLNSHLLSEVESTCDRVAIMRRGRVVGLGTIDELTGMQLEVDVRASGLNDDLRVALAAFGRITFSKGDRLTIQAGDESVLPGIAAVLVNGGAQLYSLTPRRLSLEDLFVRLVEGDTA
ncbi:MAG: ABC transporter ATP-binding protein [Anaerolineae bacterium]|nr:ABC transporter ATP-binding protein [Anaerolineae bacterium]